MYNGNNIITRVRPTCAVETLEMSGKRVNNKKITAQCVIDVNI